MDRINVLTNLDADGWCVIARDASPIGALTEQVRVVAQCLGKIAPGRNRQLVEHVVPQDTHAAHAGSLSSVYGLNSLPLHTDTAHWPLPCRYLVIACAEIGPLPAPTVLLDGRLVTLSNEEDAVCRRASFLVRNGRHSFYGSILESSREFIRLDLGCMIPLSSQGQAAAQMFSAERHKGVLYSHEWRAGDILVIDNWRVLHGRGGERTAPGRILLRAMVR